MTSLLGGVMAERWGGRHVVGISLFLSGLVTGLSPLLARDSFWPIFAARFALGVLGVSDKNPMLIAFPLIKMTCLGDSIKSNFNRHMRCKTSREKHPIMIRYHMTF